MSDQDTGPEHEELRNTLYRKVTRGKRRLTRGRLFAYRIAVAVAYRDLSASAARASAQLSTRMARRWGRGRRARPST